MEAAHHQPLLKSTQDLKEFRSTVPPQQKYPYVFDSQLQAKQHAGFIGGNRISLPETSERVQNIGQMAFANCTQLNRIQSVVYPVAYHSNENMLVCAPTGAGKTNVAMLAIVHTIRSHLENGVINRDQFKIVYIAPMKALASEMVANFSKRLKALNIIVKELTGDMQLTKTEMTQTQILVTTPEKWDVVTRKGAGDVALISLVKLLIIDEVHLLHGDRGPVVEAIVARTLRLVESSQSMIRNASPLRYRFYWYK